MDYNFRQQYGRTQGPMYNLDGVGQAPGANPWAYDASAPSPNPFLGRPDGRLLAPDLRAPVDHYASDRWSNHSHMDALGSRGPPQQRQMDEYLSRHMRQDNTSHSAPSSLHRSPEGWTAPQYAPEGPSVYNRGLAPFQPQYAFHGTPTPPRQRAPSPPRQQEHERDRRPVGAASWEILVEGQSWQPWDPGVPFYGMPGEMVNFRVGPHDKYAVFDNYASGVEVNRSTGLSRCLRRRPAFPTETTRETAKEQASFQLASQDVRASPSTSLPREEVAPHTHSAIGNENGRPLPGESEVMHEAYRELQKLEKRRGQLHQSNDLELPEVIEMSDRPLDESSVLADGLHSVAENRTEPDVIPEPVEMRPEPDACAVLEALQSQLQAVEIRFEAIVEAFDEEATTGGQARDNLAQLEARLAKLQCNGIDAVSTAGLAPDKAEVAKMLRKELTNKAERLQSRMDSMFHRIKSKQPTMTALAVRQ